ncbi:hypothetical protein [Sphingobium olei]|uniref:AbiV family abortive infection protein n=1 Tax=Sphingobium olei TaxID=420955 RepID=A0ABW3P215_9SPHN|nr:hypothetical protein [Sphingobium sp.]
MEENDAAFLKLLADDVDWALGHIEKSDTQAARRNLLRNLVSAAEGVSWIYRMHVMSIARHFDAATPLAEMAFAETSYSVTEQGVIVEQARHISMTAMIRLTTKVAQSFCNDAEVDFGGTGWANFKRAIAARNRITHPKRPDDLLLTDEEIDAAKTGFFWFSDMAVGVMEATLKELASDAQAARKLLEMYKSGDPETLALFERAHHEAED